MATENWEEFPSYWDLYDGIEEFVVKTYREQLVEVESPEPEWHYYNIETIDFVYIILFSVFWTILRHFATKFIFKPLASRSALTPSNEEKMPESAWKFLYYLCAWTSAFYIIVLSGQYKFFQKPSTVWNGWSLDKPPPNNLYFMYMTQCGFYLHSLYATVCLDTWRKDSLVMMIHHVLTLALISISYSLRYHNIGSLVLLTHDVCDILLEFTKLNVYFKIQGGKLVKKHEVFANISFFCFAVAWYVFRLYIYPMRVLYTATSVVQRHQLVLPGALLMNSLLWILQMLNIYWFLFIVQFLYRVATGQVREVDDTREYDVEEKFRLSAKPSHLTENGLLNGAVKSNGSFDESAVLNGELPARRRKED